MESITTLPKLPPRAADCNKGIFGKALIVAGSRGMSGAAALTATAALRAGAGLVRVAAPAEILPIVAAANPCYTTIALEHDADGRVGQRAAKRISSACEDSDAIAAGPGLGRSAELSQVLHEVLRRAGKPIILDADGLNAFAGAATRLRDHAGPLVVTPHPGEFARLTGKSVSEIQENRTQLAAAFAREIDAVVVLKGYGTIVTDGQRLYRNPTGNPGLATGGTGDVLTGIIAALAAQGLATFEAAQLGVYLHGLAGDLARREVGEISLIATDVIDYLPRAFARL